MDSSTECQANRASATSGLCFVAKDEGKSAAIASIPFQGQHIRGGLGSDALIVEELSSLDDFEEIFKQIDFGGESAEIDVDVLESNKEINPAERQAETANASYSCGEKAVDIRTVMSFENSSSVTWKEGETCNTFLNLSGEGSMSNATVTFCTGGSSLLSKQAPFESLELKKHSMLTGIDQSLGFYRPVLNASDLDNLSSPRSFSLDTSLVEKLDPSSTLSPFIKFDSSSQEFTQANQTESQAQNTDKSLNVNHMDQKSYENDMNQVNNASKQNQATTKLCQFSQSRQQNLLDNCCQLDCTEEENRSEKHNQCGLILNECPTSMSLNVQQFGTHNHDADFPGVYQDQACNLGSAGFGLRQTINNQTTSTMLPLQRVGFKHLIDAKDVASSLQRSLSGVSSNRQRSRIPTKRSEEEADGLCGLKRERHVSMEILQIHNSEMQNKKQRVEADGEEGASILKRSECEDPCLKPGLSAANAILNILYPQIFFLLNHFTKVEQGDERQLDANKLLDLELQALAVQQKLPVHICSALSSTAAPNNFPFSTNLSLIRHIHHKLLTQLQSMESRACNIIKGTIMRFHFLHPNSSEVCRLKTSSLKALCREHRSMLLKSFRDSILLQHSKEIGSNYVQSSLNARRPVLCSSTKQDQEANLCPASATPSSHECETLDASVCDFMTSINPASLYCTGEDTFESSTDTSRRKRLPKEACTFMDKYLLTNRGRIKRGEKEAIAKLLKLTFKQVEIYLSNARARKFKHRMPLLGYAGSSSILGQSGPLICIYRP